MAQYLQLIDTIFKIEVLLKTKEYKLQIIKIFFLLLFLTYTVVSCGDHINKNNTSTLSYTRLNKSINNETAAFENEAEITTDNSINRDVKDLLIITQGVYGQVTSQDDIGSNPVEYFPEFRIDIFDYEPSDNPNDGAAIHLSAESDDRGFFEAQLKTGTYWICSFFRRCTTININENKIIRMDYEFSAGPGWSLPVK